jgi:hypothetical protein
MGFNCVVGLPLEVHGLTLAQYMDDHLAEAKAVFDEAVAACSAAVGVNPHTDGWDAMRESASHLGWVRVATAKALDFRNRAVVALAAKHGLAAPANSQLLRLHERMCATTPDRETLS